MRLNDVFKVKNCMDIFTDGTNVMVGKTAGAMGQVKAMVSDCTNSIVLFINTHLKKEKFH